MSDFRASNGFTARSTPDGVEFVSPGQTVYRGGPLLEAATEYIEHLLAERSARGAESGRVDHAAAATDLLSSAGLYVTFDFATQTGESKADVLTNALTHATLALAEQQRIANLIALGSYRLGPGEYPVFRHLVVEPQGEHDVAPAQAIREGLSL